VKYEGIEAVGYREELNARRLWAVEALHDPVVRDFEGETVEYSTLVPTTVLTLSGNEGNVSDNVSAVVSGCTLDTNNGPGGSAADRHIQLVILPKCPTLGP
jgi:hypothetical protein